MSEMTSRKPYLLRAIFQWIVDNGCTPHLVIAYPGKGWVSGVPEHLLQEETLVLNISPSAAPDCVIENQAVYFSTRFGGVPHQVSVAIEAIAALIARENQEGMAFELEDDIAEGPKPLQDKATSQKRDSSSVDKTPKRSSHLKIIK